MAMDFSWLPPGQDARRLPLGMRVNNPGNIKYNPKLGYAGMLGPSSHTDQGDPQMTFDTPQSGMNAMASLVRTKYKRGQTTPMSIIAGNSGWTPGNTQAAANVARTMGIDPNEDLGLDDPERMTKFLKALTLQEHGASSSLYGDDIYKNAVSNGGGAPVPYMTQALNAAATIPTAQPVAGTTGTMGKLPDFGPIPSERRRAMAEALYGQSFRTASSATNPLGALAAIVQAGVGSHLGGKYDDEKASRTRRMAEALAGATDNDSLFRTMLASGDDDLIKAAVSGRIAAAKPKDPIEINGRLVQQQPGGGYKEVYAAPPKPQGPMEVKGRIVQQQPDGTFKEVYAAPPNADPEEFGTSPQYYRDAEGNLRLGQLSKRGGMKSVDVPGEVLPGIDYRDMGTFVEGRDKRTGQVVSNTPKDIAGEAEQKEVGKGKGERQLAQPATQASVRNSLSGLDRLVQEARELKGMSGVDSMTGSIQGSGWVPTIFQDTANAEAKLETLKSQIAFNVLQAMRDASKTGGALGSIAVEELWMLQNNLASLDTRQGEQAFKDSLDRIMDYAEGAKVRLLQGYKGTYGQDFDANAAPAGQAAPRADPLGIR
jgi:hypothetical protein